MSFPPSSSSSFLHTTVQGSPLPYTRTEITAQWGEPGSRLVITRIAYALPSIRPTPLPTTIPVTTVTAMAHPTLPSSAPNYTD